MFEGRPELQVWAGPVMLRRHRELQAGMEMSGSPAWQGLLKAHRARPGPQPAAVSERSCQMLAAPLDRPLLAHPPPALKRLLKAVDVPSSSFFTSG